jgi:filamentous hemagglutinin family protein
VLLLGALEVSAPSRGIAATLPVPGSVWVTSGSATGTQTATTFTVNQASSRAIFNWDSFNISKDGRVVFNQPDANSIALNKIADANPSQIFGTLQANGQLYLINQNGILFGSTARVNVGGLVASTLAIDDKIFLNGLTTSTNQALPAFSSPGNAASVVVQPGAQLTTNATGQRILLAASTIDNQGSITANDGQVILAAGDSVYVNVSTDPSLRGLLVEVDGNGSVTNTGTVTAERGNITAVGLAVNQSGRMTATTSVSENGSIRLLARNINKGSPNTDQLGNVTWLAHQGGGLTLGAGSVTEVNVDGNDPTAAAKAQAQVPSKIELVGKSVEFAGGSTVAAAGGLLNVVAATDPSASRDNGTSDAGARIRVDSGAVIDLSGSVAKTSVTSNLVSVGLFSNELADSPQQRAGALYRQTVVVDARVGTPVANVQAAIDGIGHTVQERTAAGGSVTFDSAGDVVVANNARVDVSGGAVNYTGGFMQTTQLIKADGSTIDIGKASPNATYIGLVNPYYKYVSDRWGVTKLIAAPGVGKFEQGYTQGADAGRIQFLGNTLVLNGDFIGNATNGAYQRSSGIAQGGQFIIGASLITNADGTTSLPTAWRAPEIDLVSKATPIVVTPNASLPSGLPLELSTAFITKGGFSRIQIGSDSAVKIAADTPVNLSDGGLLTLYAPRIELNSDIHATSGSVSANAVTGSSAQPGLFVGSGVSIDVSGGWINDALVPTDQTPSGLVFTKGGSITLAQSEANGTLQIGDDVSLQVSGGAWLAQSGAITGGAGGNISVLSNNAVNSNQTSSFGNNFAIDGFGVQGASGGSFTLRTPRVAITGGHGWLTRQVISSNATTGNTLQLGSALFTDFGFANFSIRADSLALTSTATPGNPGTVLSVKSGTTIDLSPKTWLLDSSASGRSSQAAVGDFATATQLPDFRASAASLTLTTSTSLGSPVNYPGLSIESGATITGNASSTVNLSSTGSLDFAGTLNIAHGTANFTLLAPDGNVDVGYVSRALTVDSGSRINVAAGAAIFQPNDLGLNTGTLLDGGKVALIANRGSVNVMSGSSIDVSGTQATLDIKPPTGGGFVHETVSTVAGAVTVQAEESIALQGDLQAHGGVSSGVANTGGTLSVTFTRVLAQGPNAYPNPTGARVIQLVNNATATPTDGVAAIDVALIKHSGVDSLLLNAGDQNLAGGKVVSGQIAIGSGVDLHLNRALTLNASTLSVLGSGTATLSAGYMVVGSQQSVSQLPAATGGAGRLNLTADQMDLVGSLALNNIDQATLSSNGDINLKSFSPNGAAISGNLLFTGSILNLQAERILPTTESSYAITGDSTKTTVNIGQEGSSSGTPLSVGGSLSINAANINQNGTLLAPFGSITLNASNILTLSSGSVTSVSSNSLLPFGRVDNGNAWVWGPNPTLPGTIAAIPDRTVSLKGATVNMAGGAVVDVSGGGDLLAYQFTPGTGGSKDVLAGNAGGMYAIIPALSGQSAAYDPMMWSGSTLGVGQSVYLASGSGVPAGVYQLLPARYALLPGAYLVSTVSGYQDLTPGATATTADGAKVVAGYMSFGNQVNAAARYVGFAVRPGSDAHTLAQYDDQLASAFFVANAGDSTTHVVVPNDAGTLSVAVTQSLTALGTLRGQGANNGGNADVELSAPDIDVTASSGDSTTTLTRLSSSTLGNWHIGRLLLGGQRDSAGNVNVKTNTITVSSGANLTADEVVLTAASGITVASGASVHSTSGASSSASVDATRFAAQTDLNLTGSNADKAAVLAVSDLAYLVTQRDTAQSNNGATIKVASGAQIGTKGAIAIDGSGAVQLASNTISADGASWSMGASHVAFGDAGSATDGLAIDGSLQANLRSARAITVSSGGNLDFAQATTLGNSSTELLSLNAAQLNNLAGSASSTLNAKQIVLQGVTGPTSAPVSGNGTLTMNANDVVLGNGDLGISGFSATTFNATGMVMSSGTGSLTTAGDLNISSAGITTTSGTHTIVTAQNVQLTATGTAPDINAQATGGTLAIKGQNIVDGARIVMPSGVVSLTANNNLTLQDSAIINAAGIKPATAASGSNGGAITLVAGDTAGGALSVAQHAQLNVSGGAQADAGSIDMYSSGVANIAGQLQGRADSGAKGGEFHVQAQSIANFSALNRGLEQGGFTEARSYRVASGDLTVAGSDTVTAQQISLTADAGAITVNGSLIARSDAQRSSIAVSARNNVVVGASAVLDASAIDATSQRGGSIELATTTGHIQMAGLATVRAAGVGQSGSLTLRAPSTSNDLNLDSIPADLSKVDAVIIEPMRSGGVYQLTGAPAAAAFTAIKNDLNTYVNNAKTTALTRLGLNTASNVYFRPYADITRSGDLTLPDLYLDNSASSANALWRFAGQPAVISIRASGNLTVTGTISDGFTAATSAAGPTVDLLNTPASGSYSTSLNFVAGADLGAAVNTATTRNGAGDFVLADGGLIRTGTGSINISAAHDIAVGSGASIYTGGTKGASSTKNDDGIATYPDKGGSIHLSASNDVLGSVTQQAVADWLTRSCSKFGDCSSGSAFWGVDFGAFNWNVGALGGGDVAVSAGHNVVDLSAAVADSNAKGATATSRIQLGGGNLSVTSGQDVQTGYFYVANGVGDVHVLGALSASGNRINNGQALGTLLMSGNTSYKISAIGDVLLEGEVQASALSPTRSADDFAYFLRYQSPSSLDVQSAGGNLRLNTGNVSAFAQFGDVDATAASVMPASVRLSSFGGDLNLTKAQFTSIPATTGQLALYAQQDVVGSSGGTLSMSGNGSVATQTSVMDSPGVLIGTDIPATAVHQNDATAAVISAGRDVMNLDLQLPKAAQITAGRDIVDLNLKLEQSGVNTSTVISAGRDVYYIPLTGDNDKITVGGTGLLEVLAGRNIDLGISRGITTTGNLLNANLSANQGASIIAIAGLSQPLGIDTGSSPDFIDAVIGADTDAQAQLIAYVQQQTASTNLDLAAATSLYRAMPLIQQLPLATRILFKELVSSGHEANAGSPLGFQRGYAAIASLFPNSLTDSNPYKGNIAMAFSRIYTLNGGSIALMTPGGGVNVGLANPPANLAARPASELGIVAQQAGDVDIMSQGDVLVSTSRIFTLGGGDIAIWSSRGNIDAGKGAKSSLSAPPPTLSFDAAGNVNIELGAAVSGSGIRTITTDNSVKAGNVDLIAPSGFVNAGDAGIGSAGNLNIAARSVVGLDNIQVVGTSTGVPPETAGLGAALSAANTAASGTSNSASNSVSTSQVTDRTGAAPLAETALSWLEVFVVGLGEENCKQDDLECLKRQVTK